MRKLHLFSTLVALFLLATSSLWALPTSVVDGQLTKGMFSIACGEYVYFSQGNLQYIGSAETPYWKFADEQYEYFGMSQSGSTAENIDRDLFGWGTKTNPWNTSTNSDDYSWNEWGENAISNGGNTPNSGWRTLTANEWFILFMTRQTGNTINTTINARYTAATILTDGEAPAKDIHGLILFPNDYAGPTSNTSDITWGTINAYSEWTTTCTTTGWNALEEAGCVFFSASGDRGWGGPSVVNVGYEGTYWSSNTGANLMFNKNNVNAGQGGYTQRAGCSVRLVKDVPAELAPAIPLASVATPPTAVTGLVYNGSHKDLVNAASGATGGYVRYKLSTQGEVGWNGTPPDAYNAGEYTVQWYVKDSGCYVDSEVEEIHVTIARGTASAPNPMPTIAAASLTYNGTPQNLVTATGSIQSDYTTVYSTDGVNWSTTIPQGTDAGGYTVYYKFYKGVNEEYIPSPNTINASIAKANIDLTGVTLPEATSTIPYDGDPHTLVEITPIPDNCTVSYKLVKASGRPLLRRLLMPTITPYNIRLYLTTS